MSNCKSDQIINPASGRCVSKTGKIGKQLLKGKVNDNILKVGPKVINPKGPKVINPKGPKGPDKIPKVIDHPDKDVLRLEICGKNMIRNPNTGRCIKTSGPVAKKLMSVPYLIVNPEKPVGPIKPVKYVKPFEPDSKKGYDKTALDQNEDGYISIKEYLDATKSLGPLEKSGGLFHFYNQKDLGITFVLTLIKNQTGPIHHIGCIPLYLLCIYKNAAGKYYTQQNIIIKKSYPSLKPIIGCDPKGGELYDGNIVNTYASIAIMNTPVNDGKFINNRKPQVFLPPNLSEAIDKCKNKGKSMVVCDLTLIRGESFDGKTEESAGHSNVIIFDTRRNTIERFDPHGGNEYSISDLQYDNLKNKGTGKQDFNFGNSKIKSHAYYDQDKIDKLLTTEFKNVLPNYRYYGTNETTPYLGPQIKADAYGGLCVTWSCMYMVLRLLNPDLSPIEVTRKMIDGTPAQLLDRIKRFQKYIIRTLQKENKYAKYLF